MIEMKYRNFQLPDNIVIRNGLLAGMSRDEWASLSAELYATREMYSRQRIVGGTRLLLSDELTVDTRQLSLPIRGERGIPQGRIPLHIVVEVEDQSFEDLGNGVRRGDSQEQKTYRQMLREGGRKALVLGEKLYSSIVMGLLPGTKQGTRREEDFCLILRLWELGYRGEVTLYKSSEALESVKFNDYDGKVELKVVEPKGKWKNLERTLGQLEHFDIPEITK